MGFFNEFPHTRTYDNDLGWLIKTVKEIMIKLDDFIKLNTIKYADPIIWNITTQYEANTVVIDGNTGTAYISTAPVPSGVSLTNTDYWTPIFTLDLMSANQNITFRDDGNNVNATFESVTGDWLLWKSNLYKVTQAISLNTAYIEGFNLERYSVELFIKDYLNNLLTMIGDLDDLNTSDKTSVVNAINELIDIIGDLSTLNTTDKTSVVNAINEVVNTVDDLSTKLNNLMIYNVRDYGATGDGVTDDSTSIQAAVDAVNATGGILYFPQGHYKVSTTFSLTHVGTCVTGASSQGTYIYQDADSNCFEFGDGNTGLIDVRVQHIGIIYSSDTAPTSTTCGIYFNYCVNSSIEDVIVGDFAIGVRLKQTGNTLLNNIGVVSKWPNSIGFYVGERSVSSSLTNSYAAFTDNAIDNGIGFYSVDGDIADFTLKYFDVGNGAYGVVINGSDSPAAYPPTDIRLYDVVVDGTRTSCISISNINANGSVLISGGWFNPLRDLDNNCIYLNNTNNVIIDNVTCQSITDSDAHTNGVIASGAAGTKIVNSNFINISAPVIFISSTGNITGNTIVHAVANINNCAILCSNSSNLIITDNNVDGDYTVGSIIISGTGDNSIVKDNIVKTACSDVHTAQIFKDNIINGVVTP